MITGKNFIGQTLSNCGGVSFRTFNPELNKENEWLFYEASDDEIQEATKLAADAFKSFRNSSSHERALFLKSIADEMNGISHSLIQTYCSETGLPASRAEIELIRTIFQIRTFAQLLSNEEWRAPSIDRAIRNRLPVPKPDLRKHLIPIGPIAVFGSSNFPFAYSTAGGDTASALAAGCPVVVKSHPMHAGTGELVAGAIIRAAQKTGMPNGVFSNLNSSGIEVGEKLVLHPCIKAVGFTGSIKGGRALLNLANKRDEPIPVFAEMGSINPVVMSENALEINGKVWAEKYAESITLGTGQFCTSPGLFLAIDSTHLDRFTNQIAEKIMTISPSCMLHPSIKLAFSSGKERVLRQPEVIEITSKQKVDANYADQTIVKVKGDTFLSNPNLRKEVFGPFAIVVACGDEDELLRIIENLEGQLTGTIIAEPGDWHGLDWIIDALQQRVGRIIYNGVSTGVEVCDSMHHGGPYPATTDARFTAVGSHSIKRWLRPVAFQNFPNQLLPKSLKDE